jgi:L-fuconolactonase
VAFNASPLIIDTHIHVLQPSRWHYHWLDANSPCYRDFQLTDIEVEMKTSGVSSGVLVEATNHPDEIEGLLEISVNSWLQPGVIGWMDQNQLELTLPTFVSHPLFKGMRLNWLEDHVDSKRFVSLLQVAREHHLVVEVLTRVEYLPLLADLFADYPDIVFVLNHMGGIDLRDTIYENWRTELLSVAKLPNVIGKLSGFSALPLERLKITLLELIEVSLPSFGSDRLMFGSNVPFGLEQISYTEIVNAFREAVKTLPIKNREDICFRTAQRIYHLPLPTGI